LKVIDFHESQQGQHAIKGNLEATHYNPRSFNHSKMADVQTSEVGAKLTSVDIGL